MSRVERFNKIKEQFNSFSESYKNQTGKNEEGFLECIKFYLSIENFKRILKQMGYDFLGTKSGIEYIKQYTHIQ